MVLVLGRSLLAVAAIVAGWMLASSAGLPPLMGGVVGAAAAGVAIGLELAISRASLGVILWTAGGGVAGLALGVALVPLDGGPGAAVRLASAVLGAWVGGAAAARRAGEPPRQDDGAVPARILDTSVLVDGRIADVADAGFVDGAVIVPQFVVRELQRLADAGDPLRRARGRRGFDVLERLRHNQAVRLEVTEVDFPAISDVDAKLVALARARAARLLTNDTALARVAGLAGVPVGSLNDLAGSMRPVALPGEGMQVHVVREGREPGQGVAYLDDGTMVVVEGGKRFIGQSLDVVVTSMLQTSAGRMIFTRPRGEESAARDA
jgi:rRNA-processing protein FCF1